MRTTRSWAQVAIWSSLLLPSAQAQYVIDNLSFGHKSGSFSISDRRVEGWQVSGEQHTPDLLTDRIILTPPYPGNKRGSIWSENTMPNAEWEAELQFRASGQDRSGGNMQIWYAKDGKNQVGTNSLYTVDKFDGLMLAVDQYAGRGGTIRGFLNDGTKSFKSHHMVDTLAFGTCDFAYKNLGRFIPISIKQTANGFEVVIDGNPCFRSNQVVLPTGYQFGVTAASAENPDSFEVMSLKVSTTGATTREEPNRNPWQNNAAGAEKMGSSQAMPGSASLPPTADKNGVVPEVLAESIKDQQAQFADVHNRLQAVQYQINSMYGEIRGLAQKQADNHAELLKIISASGSGSGSVAGAMSNEAKQVQDRIEQTVNAIRKDIEGKDYRDMISTLQQVVTASHSNMLQSLPLQMDQILSTKGGPKLSTFVFVIVAVQIMLVGAYIVYKRKMKSMPKKFL